MDVSAGEVHADYLPTFCGVLLRETSVADNLPKTNAALVLECPPLTEAQKICLKLILN